MLVREGTGSDVVVVRCGCVRANGRAVRGSMRRLEEGGAALVGCAFPMEKGFQGAGDALRAQGIRVDSRAIVDAMTDESVIFRAQG